MTLAEKYEKYFVPAIMDQWARDLVQIVSEGDHVLDVACGTGVVSRHAAAEAGENGKVVGLDLSPEMLSVARSISASINRAIEWREADVVSMPFDDATFDIVLCQFGLMFMPDKLAALNEMNRVLKPGGNLGLNVWCSGPYDQVFEAALAKHVGSENARSEIWAFGDPDWLRSLAKEGGFKVITLEKRTKLSRFESIRQSVELTLDWSPALQSLPDEALEQVISEMEAELAGYVRSETLAEWPESANVLIASA